MIESPTYYRAYQPILKTLQDINVENMPFIDELVYLKTGARPDFLDPDVKFDWSIVYDELPEELKKKKEEEEKDENHQDGENRSKKYVLGVRPRNSHQYITLQDFFQTSHNSHSIFDEYQEEAVKECLRNQIGIIQGPPGCGKTFIGIHMLRLLLSLESLNNPKVLVLTYKNHALDEFLKGIMRFVFFFLRCVKWKFRYTKR